MDLNKLISDDNAMRDLINRMRHDGDDEVYLLARVADALMLQRDRRAEDFYASNRRIAFLEGELAKARAEHGKD